VRCYTHIHIAISQYRTRKIHVQNNKTLNYTKHKQIDIPSHSTRTSRVTEWRLKKSAPTFSDPLIALRVNWYCWRTKAQRMRRPFCPYWASLSTTTVDGRLQNKFLSIEKVLKLLYGPIHGTLFGPIILPRQLNAKSLDFQNSILGFTHFTN